MVLISTNVDAPTKGFKNPFMVIITVQHWYSHKRCCESLVSTVTHTHTPSFSDTWKRNLFLKSLTVLDWSQCIPSDILCLYMCPEKVPTFKLCFQLMMWYLFLIIHCMWSGFFIKSISWYLFPLTKSWVHIQALPKC